MRTLILSVIGASSVFMIVMIHGTINTESILKREVEDSLSEAMMQTMTEIADQNSYGIDDRNEMIAAFMQAMIVKLDRDLDLTVTVHHCDYEKKLMDIEVTGNFCLPDKRTKAVSVRRQVVLTE